MEIGELTEKFEQEAKALGYELMAVVSYNPATDRHQVNWNDKAPMEIRNPALEGVALCLMELADEDPDLIIEAIRRAVWHTEKGHEYWINQLTDLVTECFSLGIELGNEILKKDQEDQEEQKTLDIGEWKDGE